MGDGIHFEFLKIFVLDDDGHAEETERCQYIQEDRFQGDWASRLIRQNASAGKHFVPDLYTLRFGQLYVTDGSEEALKELPAGGQVETLERIPKKLKVRVLHGQTHGHQTPR